MFARTPPRIRPFACLKVGGGRVALLLKPQVLGSSRDRGAAPWLAALS
jgi:hypothetical protein